MLEINPNLPVAIKKYWESSWMPIVPGPTMSANTFTIEKAPLIIPNPSPETVSNIIVIINFMNKKRLMS